MDYGFFSLICLIQANSSFENLDENYRTLNRQTDVDILPCLIILFKK